MKSLFGLALGLLIGGSVNAFNFEDQHEFPVWAGDAIEVVADKGIMKGFGDGYFRPDQLLTRAETVTLLVRAMPEDFVPHAWPGRFPDVPQDAWFAKNVAIAAGEDWVKGRPDGKFYPGDTVNWAEFAKLIVEAFELDLEAEPDWRFTDLEPTEWYYPYVERLYDNGLVRQPLNLYFRPEREVTRGEAAWVFANLAVKEAFNGEGVKAPVYSGVYSDSRRVAIKPRDFEDHQQGYEIERSALHVHTGWPIEDSVVDRMGEWVSLGHIEVVNTLGYRARLDHLQLFLRFDSGEGPAEAFAVRLSHEGLEVKQNVYRNGEVSFVGLDQFLETDESQRFAVEVRLSGETSYYPKPAEGTLYVKEAEGQAFRPYDPHTGKAAEAIKAPVEYNTRNLKTLFFEP